MKKIYFLVLFFFLSSLLFAAEQNSSPLQEPKEEKTKQEDFPFFDEKQAQEESSLSSQKLPSYETTFAKTIAILIGLLLLIFLTVWMFRKMSQGRVGGFQSGKSIRLLEKRPLSPKSMLYLVEVNGTKILLAESQVGLRSLATFESPSIDHDL